MSESPLPPAQALEEHLQAQTSTLAAGAAQAIDQAAQTANEIAGDIQGVVGAAPEPPGPATPPADRNLSAPPPALASPPHPELQRLLAIEVPVIVQLGVRRMSVGEVMRFSVGSIIEFQKAADEELDLLANNKPIGKGHAVKVSENFGIKLTAIGSVKEMIRTLGT